MKTRRAYRLKRKGRIKQVLRGTKDRPRLAVYRSHKNISVQIIDDQSGQTLLGAKGTGKNMSQAKNLGVEIAKRALQKGITSIVFDRGGYRYHGVVAALADSLERVD